MNGKIHDMLGKQAGVFVRVCAQFFDHRMVEGHHAEAFSVQYLINFVPISFSDDDRERLGHIVGKGVKSFKQGMNEIEKEITEQPSEKKPEENYNKEEK